MSRASDRWVRPPRPITEALHHIVNEEPDQQWGRQLPQPLGREVDRGLAVQSSQGTVTQGDCGDPSAQRHRAADGSTQISSPDRVSTHLGLFALLTPANTQGTVEAALPNPQPLSRPCSQALVLRNLASPRNHTPAFCTCVSSRTSKP